MKPQTITTGLLALLMAILVPLVGWSVVATRSHGDALIESKAERKMIIYKLDELQKDRDIDVEQNRRLAELKSTDSKFWKWHAAVKKEIDKMRVAMGLPLMDWPTFDAHLHD